MDPDLLVPPRELWDFTGLHVFLHVEIKVVECKKGTLDPKVKSFKNWRASILPVRYPVLIIHP